jgi:hypothetical protein
MKLESVIVKPFSPLSFRAQNFALQTDVSN